MNFNELYNNKLALVEDALKRLMEQHGDCPPTLLKAMNYSLFAGGKRIRPVLLLAAHELVGGNIEESMALACGLEMIHTYSLIHDDLPAMDDDDLRRGMPTNHKVFGEGMAILAGDGLLNLAYEVFLENAMKYPHKLERHVRAAFAIARAAGIHGMIGGQVADLEQEGKEVKPDVLFYIHTHKTGALIEAAVRAGAILEPIGEDVEDAIAKYGQKLGLAFQIVDDILDVTGDAASMGKNPNRDQAHQKATFPALYGLKESQRMAQELIDQAVSHLDCFGKDAGFLKELARYVLKRQK
ncbi:geranylgeranyl diphosphate synthase type II [Caldicoprobacter guelmensis]|uniref:polyprenyl synthetase family protein n=1 Tax=Caldicoprobacter guelmensis TaxID=1170224 RepID=UPI00195B5B11|nr:farnesyl diphosphate synthase [Caldicoprobacter guelmensis]MBM7581298.1 geranylgeranyl diphosphate synthase type II [Caldicoprobacter guelmensis]